MTLMFREFVGMFIIFKKGGEERPVSTGTSEVATTCKLKGYAMEKKRGKSEK